MVWIRSCNLIRYFPFAFSPISTSRRMASERETLCFLAHVSSDFIDSISNRAGMVPAEPELRMVADHAMQRDIFGRWAVRVIRWLANKTEGAARGRRS
jgi:hypothetical protein